MSQEFFSKWSWFIEWMTPWHASLKHIKRVLYQGRSKFQDIAVVELEGMGLALILDGKTQSGEWDEFIYHEALVHPALMLHGSPKRVLILGGGEGATLREALKASTVEEAVMVDIDEEVIRVSREYLEPWHKGAFDDPRAKIVIMDAWDYVENSLSRGEKFDVIIADLVDPQEAGPATRLYTVEYYSKLRRLLGEDGVFVTQATSISHTPNVHAIIRNTVEAAFGRAVSYGVYVPSFDSLWGFVIASAGKDPNTLLNKDYLDSIASRLYGGYEKHRFLDYSAMLHMFGLPKNYREAIAAVREVATLENQVFMPA